MKYNCIFVVIFALVAAGNTLADVDAETSNGAAIVVPAKTALPAMMVNKSEAGMDMVVENNDKLEESNLQVPEVKDEVLKAIEDLSDDDAEIMEQPGMQRLARELNQFHGRQQHYRVRQVAAVVPSDMDDEDEQEAVAEERAIRRRKRVRRRNSNNQVRRTQENKQTVNRRKTSRRPSSGNRNLVKRKNNQNSNRNNNGSPSKRRNGNSGKNGVRKSGKRQTNNRNQGMRNSNRKGSSTRKNNKNRRSKKQKKRVQETDDDYNMARGDQHQEQMLDAAEAA